MFSGTDGYVELHWSVRRRSVTKKTDRDVLASALFRSRVKQPNWGIPRVLVWEWNLGKLEYYSWIYIAIFVCFTTRFPASWWSGVSLDVDSWPPSCLSSHFWSQSRVPRVIGFTSGSISPIFLQRIWRPLLQAMDLGLRSLWPRLQQRFLAGLDVLATPR